MNGWDHRMAEIIEMGDDIVFIRRDWMNSNSVLIKGRENVLVDTGYIHGIPSLLSLLKECGVGPENIDLIVNTHFHSDHVGANLAIQELSGAAIATGEFEADCVNRGDRWTNWLDFVGQQAPVYNVDRVLVGGKTVTLGERRFQVIDTPGHSPGGISLYNRDLGMLLSGDALWEGDFGPVNCVIHGPRAVTQARESLQKLAALEVGICLPGHGAPIPGHRQNADRCLRKIGKMEGDLKAVALHFITRVLTFMIMVEGGIEQRSMGDYIKKTGWVQKFNDLYVGMELDEFIDMVMTRLCKGGVVRVERGIIKAGE